jgi:hypothetical protein
VKGEGWEGVRQADACHDILFYTVSQLCEHKGFAWSAAERNLKTGLPVDKDQVAVDFEDELETLTDKYGQAFFELLTEAMNDIGYADAL